MSLVVCVPGQMAQCLRTDVTAVIRAVEPDPLHRTIGGTDRSLEVVPVPDGRDAEHASAGGQHPAPVGGRAGMKNNNTLVRRDPPEPKDLFSCGVRIRIALRDAMTTHTAEAGC